MKLATFFLISFAAACGRSSQSSSQKNEARTDNPAGQVSPNTPSSAEVVLSQQSQKDVEANFPGCGSHCSQGPVIEIRRQEENPLSVSMRRAEPLPFLLGPEALQEIYTRVFGIDPRKTGTFFTITESDKLGGYRIISPSRALGGNTPLNSNMVPIEKLSFEYLYVLRNFTASACKILVDKEFMDASSSQNYLVEGRIPSTQKINSFLSSLLGYSKPGQLHYGVEKYHASFVALNSSPGLLETTDQRNERSKDVYIHLCVALATDVRVYTR